MVIRKINSVLRLVKQNFVVDCICGVVYLSRRKGEFSHDVFYSAVVWNRIHVLHRRTDTSRNYRRYTILDQCV